MPQRSPLRISYRDALITVNDGLPTKVFQDWLTTVSRLLAQKQVLVLTDFGPVGNGADDTAVLQLAINQAVALGGATILFPVGLISITTVTVPVGISPITFLGRGITSVVRRRSSLTDGKGMFDVSGSNVTFESLVLDGNVTVPVGLYYNQDFQGVGGNDPMAPALSTNSLVWIHGPGSNYTFKEVVFIHASGYSIVVDAGSGLITDFALLRCFFEDNRPNLFGFGAYQPIYGSWGGGVYINGDGRATNPGRVLRRLRVQGCTWLRCNGNCIWSHLYGLDELHESFQVSENYYEDIGLDGILIGGVTGGAVTGNVFRRVGYTTLTDDDRSIPRWLPNLNATAIDSSGLVKSVVYESNSMLSVNGGGVDGDGHGLTTISNNVCRIPYPTEPEYEEDRIAISGASGNGSTSYGVNISNSSKKIEGASGVTVIGNTLVNLRAGAARLFASRNCLLEANTILAPSDSIYPPIALGPIGPDPGQRCYDNRISHNKVGYNPVSSAPVVFEANTISEFLPTESNAVFGNCPITPSGTLATEFQPSPTSGSTHWLETPWFS